VAPRTSLPITPRVLVLGGQARAALEVVQSLGRRGACITVASEDADCLAFHSRYVSEKVVQPSTIRGADARQWLHSWDRQRRYDLIVPSNDGALELVRALDEDDPLRARAVVSGNAALEAALDKQSTWELARRLGVPAPASLLIPQGGPIPECGRYPVVLKPTRSRVLIGADNASLVPEVAATPETRRALLARWLPHTAVQEQQYVTGTGFGIEMLFDRGRPVWHFAHERLHEIPLTGGGSSYRRSIAAPAAALEMAEQLLRELRWHGVAMVEFRGTPGGPFHLMEINPRLWGSLALSVDCGVDFPWGLALLARGETPPPQPRYRVGYYTRDVWRDALWHLENVRADRTDPRLITRPPLRALGELVRPLLGRESWDHFDWNDLGVTAETVRRILVRDAAMLASFARRQHAKLEVRMHHRRVMQSMRQRGRPERLLFLCHGNICRSPVARHLAGRRLAGVEIDSAGFHSTSGRTSPEHLLRAALSAGLDLVEHRSRRVTAADMERADLILCMDLRNLNAVRREFPEAAGRTTLLGLLRKPALVGIPDPYSLSEKETREVIATIDASIGGLSSWLDSLPASGPRTAHG
jgi:protein-tyrosine-phosphatase/predicted ATP-grasp superfamily ATP-dependent carboligase